MELYRHYRDMLLPDEKAVYRAFEEGISALKSSFSVPKLTLRRLSDIVTMLRLDNPLLFHFKEFGTLSVPGAVNVTVKASYTMKKQQYEETKSAVMKRLDKILAPCKGMEKEACELFIHDYIVKNTVYKKLERPYSHEVTGPLFHGIGVCEGIAKTFKLMCDALSIPCFAAVGYGVSPDERTGKKSELHAWNIVWLENVPYGVDATFDLSLSNGGERICYNYYNIPDSVMMRDHSGLLFPAVPCLTNYGGLHKYRRVKRVKELKK